MHLHLDYFSLKGLSPTLGTHRFLLQLYHIRTDTTLQLRGDNDSSISTFGLFSNLTVFGALTVTAGGIRVYLIG
jgi:hypothetical protein